MSDRIAVQKLMNTQLTRRLFLGAAGAGLTSGFAEPAKRPNIVLIMADDMGFSDLGCYGSEIRTPNLDRLAAEGIRFSQFHNTSRCCPTRAALMTGLYSHQVGMGHMINDTGLPGYRGQINHSCVTIAEALKPAGYHTLMTGKWHLTFPGKGHEDNWPMQRGFEHYYGTIAGSGSYFDPVTLQRDNQPAPAKPGFYYTDAIGDQASQYIGDYAGKENPFFLYVAFTSPHWPLHALAEDIDRYKDRYASGWDKLRDERYARMVEQGVIDPKWKLTPRDESVPAWDQAPNKEWEARRMAVYAAQVDRMDQNVGKILSKLKEKGAEDNTLVLFLSDNGGCAEILGPKAGPLDSPVTLDGKTVRKGNDPSVMPGGDDTYESYATPWANASNTPFRLYKHWVHEGGTSTPLIARWPSAMKGKSSWNRQPGHLIDIMATCLDVSGATYPKSVKGQAVPPFEGISLAPTFYGRKRPELKAIYWEHEGNRAILQGKWKLVSRYSEDWELYDLEADRTEVHNLISHQPGRAKNMEIMWNSWAKRCNVAPWAQVQARIKGQA